MHGSAPNLSARPRRLLINAYHAADAIPLTPDSQHSSLYGRVVRGREAKVARRETGDIRMPPDFSKGYTSIYEAIEKASRA